MTDTVQHLDIPLAMERAAADADALTLPVSFASNNVVDDPLLGPVQLSLDTGAVDLQRAAEHGIPVRLMHQRGLPLARVEQIHVDADKLRGVMRFSHSEQGRQLHRDATDGILTDLSVGAAIYAVREEPDHLVAIRWTPREVSIVDEGADPTVGINRSKPAAPAAAQPEHIMTEPTIQPAASDPNPVAAPANEPGKNAAAILELARYADGRAPELGLLRMGEDYAAFDKPFDEFRAEVWRLLSDRQAAEPAPAAPAELGLGEKQTQQFSIVRAAHAHLTRNWKKAGFELECTRAIAENLGREAQGFFVPLEVQRTMSAGDSRAGGYLVADEHRGDMFIENLRAMSIAMQAGVQTLGGLVGNVAIPKKTSSATFGWLGEDEDQSTGDLALGSVTLTPRTVSGGVPMTRRLLMQSSPDVEAMVRADLVEGVALAIDLAVFEGSGASNEPLGLANHPDINTVTVGTDTTPTWAEVVDFESAVATDNALTGSLNYVTTPAVRGKMKITVKDAGSGLFVCADDNTVNSYPLLTSTQLATSRLLFGNFNQIVIGMWGVLDVKPDEATKAASGGLVLRVFQDADIAIRHAQAFALGT